MCNLETQLCDSTHLPPTYHCRAQRQALYSQPFKQPSFPPENTATTEPQLVFSFRGSDEDWAECRQELERWGMEVIDVPESKVGGGEEGGRR